MQRPIALITGVGRKAGIGAGIADRLADDGWDIAMTYWGAYDERMPWGRQPDDAREIETSLRDRGARVLRVEADLALPDSPARIFAEVEDGLGPVTGIVLNHAESVDSGILDTDLESFDRHMNVNVRANWLLIKEFASRFSGEPGSGRIVALTSPHTVFNLPYGASKGALDRIVLAAARELAHLRISSNVVNPGPIDTGWMTADLADELTIQTPAGRLGSPADVAPLVSFLFSQEGGWINGQLLKADGGYSAPG